jgi:hypothetical protein
LTFSGLQWAPVSKDLLLLIDYCHKRLFFIYFLCFFSFFFSKTMLKKVKRKIFKSLKIFPAGNHFTCNVNLNDFYLTTDDVSHLKIVCKNYLKGRSHGCNGNNKYTWKLQISFAKDSCHALALSIQSVLLWSALFAIHSVYAWKCTLNRWMVLSRLKTGHVNLRYFAW